MVSTAINGQRLKIHRFYGALEMKFLCAQEALYGQVSANFVFC